MNARVTVDCKALGAVVIRSADIVEGVSRSTSADIVIVADEEIDAESALEAAGCLVFANSGPQRTQALVVSAVQSIARERGSHEYLVELVHPFALLQLGRRVKTYLGKTTKQIVEDVLAPTKITLDWKATGGATAREWCVQYNESDHDFVCRLLEDEGIFWTCPDGETATLMVADAPTAFASVGGDGKLPLSSEGTGLGIHEISVEHVVTSDAVCLADWSFETPGVDLTSRTSLADAPAGEVFLYPGGQKTQDEGKARAKIRAEAVASDKVVVTGSSDRAVIGAGRWFELTSTSDVAPVGKYLVRSVRHSISKDDYANTFVASPFDLPFRPARTTARPLLDATSLTVSGASGQEIETDKYGRLRGLFAFDPDRKADDSASPWMRTLQPALGGSMLLARIGWEMVVRHLDGDPDRPVAVARMYDGEHPPPVSLPDAQAKTVFETLTTPRAEKLNALSIDDKGGAMLVEIKAAKDLDAMILHDETETVGESDTLEVGKDDTQLVGDKQVVSVEKDEVANGKKDQGVEVAGDRTKKVTKDETVKIDGGASVRVDGADTESVGADLTIGTSEDFLETAKGKHTTTIGGAVTSKAKKDYTVYVAGKSTETVAAAKTVSSSDGAVVETVGGNLSITIGGASSETVQGNRVSSAGGDVSTTVGGVSSLTAGGKLQIKGKTIKIQVSGTATFIGGGGIVSMSPASVGFVGLVTLKGSGGVEIVGAPQLAG